MTAGDDEGFKPLPGDPWHPGFGDDDAESEEAAAETPSEPDKPGKGRKKAPKGRKRRKRGRGRSKRTTDDDDEVEVPVEQAFDPSSTAFDVSDAIPGETDEEDDPFGAVLERESRPRGGADDPPPPAWTVDIEPDEDQVLPVEQPSWVGGSTEGVGIDFEPASAEGAEPDAEDGDAGPEVAGAEDAGPEDAEPVEVVSEVADSEVPVVDESIPRQAGDVAEPDPLIPTEAETESPDAPRPAEYSPDTPTEPAIAGEYGVAGPEAYRALGEEPGEVDEWDAFLQADEQPAAPEVEIPLAEAEPSRRPKRRRGLFRRKQAEEPADEVDPLPPQPTEAPPLPDDEIERRAGEAAEALFGEPTEALGDGDAFDDWVTSAQSERSRRGLFRRKRRERAESEPAGEPELTAEPEPAPDMSQAPDVPEVPAGFDPVSASEPDLPGVPEFAPPEFAASEELVGEAPAEQDDGIVADTSIADVDAAVEEALAALGETGEFEPEPAPDAPTPDAPTPDVLAPDAPAPGAADAVEIGEGGLEPEWAGADPDVPVDADTVPIDETRAIPSEPESEMVLGDRPADAEALDPEPHRADVPRADALGTDLPETGAPEADAIAEEPYEEVPDWEGDASRIPAGWFAEIDEDEVVPPPVADTPETEWPFDEDAAASTTDPDAVVPETTEAGDRVAGSGDDSLQPPVIPEPTDTDLFDIESSQVEPAPMVQEPDAGPPPVPEGYEEWGDAVDEVLAEREPDDSTYEYEPVLQDEGPAADPLPAGFERFPSEMERFELTQAELDAELGVGESGWVTQAVDSGTVDEAEFDEQIYAGPGTIEHRDLAAAIAQSGDEDTAWQAMSAAMPGLDTGVLGFEDVADLGDQDEYVEPSRSNLGARVGTGLVLVGLLFGTLLIADVAFVAFIGLMLMIGLAEFYAALRRSGYLPLTIVGLAGGLGTLITGWFHGPTALVAGVVLTSMFTYFFYAFSPTRRDALANGGLTVLGVGWIVASVGFVIPIAQAEDHVTLVIAVVVVTAAMDIGAFSFGRTWGKRPLTPVLSPNKTSEGLAGGVLMAIGAAVAIGFLELGPFDLTSALALSAVVIFFAPLGDLAESMIKRSLGIKDMGALLPGHGGVLDRIDAFLFVVPAVWALYEIAGFLG